MTTTLENTSADSGALERAADQMFQSGLAAVELVNVALGLRLGLYAALSRGQATSTELAERGGIDERYAREWLEQQAAAGIAEVDDAAAEAAERHYCLPAAFRHVLLEQDSDAYVGALVESAVTAATWLPLLEVAYRTGAGVAYADFGVHDLQAAFSRPVFANHLVQTWLPALPDVHAKLMTGAARVADIGCGEGLAAITIARGFPGVRVDGFDLDDSSIAAARRHAVEAGVAERVGFEVADAGSTDLAALAAPGGYDLVVCFEMLHDVSDPVAVLVAMRALRAYGGAVLVVDERVADRFALPVDPVERLLYSFSTLHCLPAGLARQPSAATGAVMRPETVRRYAEHAGFTSVQQLPVEHPQFRLYQLGG